MTYVGLGAGSMSMYGPVTVSADCSVPAPFQFKLITPLDCPMLIAPTWAGGNTVTVNVQNAVPLSLLAVTVTTLVPTGYGPCGSMLIATSAEPQLRVTVGLGMPTLT